MVKPAVPLQPMEVHGEAEIHLQTVEVNGRADLHLKPMKVNGGADNHPPAAYKGPHVSISRFPKEAVALLEAHTGAGSWQDLWSEEPTLEQVFWLDL
ncbi:hypothetical protein AV530_007643 [Patagioenas fasciata monilis]|uniref:Uncharacterized protein n=1 Tax=Patagioenas fasciata monilis TaxID=372326 RepID=A0A1V4JYV6_PATFA|nr:hypothetical protein AV530_007643 [Patagioenas fasciata monilis]